MSTEYKTGRFLAKVIDLGPYLQPRKVGEPIKKFGIRLEFCDPKKPENNGRTITFESMVDTDKSKERIMHALKAIGYDANAANPNPMAQKARMIGRVVVANVTQDDKGYYGVAYIDDPESPDAKARGDWNPLEKNPMGTMDTEDFVTSLVAFAKSSKPDAGDAAAAPRTPPITAPRRMAVAPPPSDEFSGGTVGDDDLPF